MEKYALGLASFWSVDGLFLYHPTGISCIDPTIHARVDSGDAAETSPAEPQQNVSDFFFCMQQTAFLLVDTSIGMIPRDCTSKKALFSALIELHIMKVIDCG
jgi:hypothetical protein